MRAAALSLSVGLAVAGCSTTSTKPGGPTPRAAIDTSAFIELPALKGRNLIHLGIIPSTDLKPGAIERGQSIGRYAPLPADRGGPFQAELLESERRYAAGDHEGAAAVLRPLVAPFDVDPFVLNAYARALYWFDCPRSFEVYGSVVAAADAMAGAGAGPNELVIHSWFAEAYWKKGTLHLDREEWPEAALEISRYLAASGLATATLAQLRAEPSAEQALQYLAEAYALMGQEPVAIRFARQTLQVAPGNTYVFEFVPAEKVRDGAQH